MFWYVLLMVLMVLSAVVMIATLFIFILSGCDVPEIFAVTMVSIVIFIFAGVGATSIKNANTTVDTEVVQMQITKCDIAGISVHNGKMQFDCYITVDNKYIIEVSREKYAELNVGDVVSVEVTTKTEFNTVKRATVNLM